MRVMFNVFRAVSSKECGPLPHSYNDFVTPILGSFLGDLQSIQEESYRSLEKVQKSFTRKLMMRTLGLH